MISLSWNLYIFIYLGLVTRILFYSFSDVLFLKFLYSLKSWMAFFPFEVIVTRNQTTWLVSMRPSQTFSIHVPIPYFMFSLRQKEFLKLCTSFSFQRNHARFQSLPIVFHRLIYQNAQFCVSSLKLSILLALCGVILGEIAC